MFSAMPKKAVIKATGRASDGPSFAIVDVTPDFVRHLKHLSVVVESNGLAYALDHYRVDWDSNALFMMRGEMLWVRSGSFFIRAHPQRSRRMTETWSVLIADLERLLESNKEIAYFGGNTERLSKLYSQSMCQGQAA